MEFNFERPQLPYTAQTSLQFDDRYQVLTNNLNAPPTAPMLDADINYLIDAVRALDQAIVDVEAGNIPGNDEPTNANKVLSTDGAGNIPWTYIADANCAVGSISGNKLIPSSVTGTQLQNGAVTNGKLAPESVNANNIIDASVTTNKIAAGAVVEASIGNNAVTANKLNNDSVTTVKIVDENVTTAKIADNAITAAKIAYKTITADQIADDTITATQLAASLYSMIAPIGTVITFAGTTGLAAGWLECNGQAVSRATYATLFANLGIIWGGGDGFTTFNVPDLRGRVPVGIGSDNSTGGRITTATAPDIVLGATGVFGTETITLTEAQMPAHTHDTYYSSNASFTGIGQVTDRFQLLATQTSSTGGGLPHSNTQPSLFIRYYIRAL